jgi:hypothetical protein
LPLAFERLLQEGRVVELRRQGLQVGDGGGGQLAGVVALGVVGAVEQDEKAGLVQVLLAGYRWLLRSWSAGPSS